MRVPSHHQSPSSANLAMTPMIDVIFQLMIFFICTANFRAPEQTLPTRLSWRGNVASAVPVEEELQDLENVVVKLLWSDAGPAWEINQRRHASLAGVRDVLAAIATLRTDLPVILDVDAAVPMQHVIDLYDLCRTLGLERIQFAAEAE